MHSIKTTFVSLFAAGIAGSLAFAPLAFAQDTAASSANSGTHTAVMVNINPAGRVLVRGAVVTGVSGSTISANTAWGSEVLSWSVSVASSTKLVGNRGAAALADIKTGDTLAFSGPLDATAGNLTVNAQVVRDVSITGSSSVSEKPAREHLLEGKLEAVSGDTLTIARGNQTITVNLTGNAEVKTKNFSITDLGSLKIGDHVRILGTGSTTVDASVIRDSSR